MTKKELPNALWCFGTSDEGYTDYDFPTREAAIETFLDENEEAERIYLAQYVPKEVRLPVEEDVDELLCSFMENENLDETWEHCFLKDEAKKSLGARLAPFFAQLQIVFRLWCVERGIEVCDFYNEEDLSREDALEERRAGLAKHAVALQAAIDASEEFAWVEGFFRYEHQGSREDAKAALPRIRAALDTLREALDQRVKDAIGEEEP